MKSDEAAIVYASPQYSMWELSNALKALNVTHTIEPINKSQRPIVKNMGRVQPMLVQLTSDIRSVRADAVNFIVASFAELQLTNYPRLPQKESLDESLRHALLNPVRTKWRVKRVTVMDFVNSIASPSLLNKLQTEIYRIQPYSLRVEVNTAMINYFAGKMSKTAMFHLLSKSLKLERLKPHIVAGAPLRVAVMRCVEGHDVELVSAETGFNTFDLRYLSKERVVKEKKTKAKRKA